MQPQITRRRLWKGARWGVITARLNVLTTANSSPFHFISSKHNPPRPKARSLLTLGMGSGLHVQWEVWVTAVKLAVRTLFPGGCPQALGTEWWEGIVLPVVFFRFDGTCQFFSDVLDRQEGGIYFIECEYPSASDGRSSPNHGTCSDG